MLSSRKGVNKAKEKKKKIDELMKSNFYVI